MNNHDKSNEKIDVVSKEPINTEKYSIQSIDVIHTLDDLIKNEPLSRPQNTNVLDTYVSLLMNNNSLLKPPENTTPLPLHIKLTVFFDQVPLGSDTLKYKEYTRTHMIYQKIPPSGDDYICFQNNGRTAWCNTSSYYINLRRKM